MKHPSTRPSWSGRAGTAVNGLHRAESLMKTGIRSPKSIDLEAPRLGVALAD